MKKKILYWLSVLILVIFIIVFAILILKLKSNFNSNPTDTAKQQTIINNGETEGKLIGNAKDIVNSGNEAKYYGAVVTNYTCDMQDENINWKILYIGDNGKENGEKNIYLITDDYIKYNPNIRNAEGTVTPLAPHQYLMKFDTSKYDYKNHIKLDRNVTTQLKKDFEKRSRVIWKELVFMLDSDAWNIYCNPTYSDYAIGGPTLEIFAKSYEQKTNCKIEYSKSRSYGYTFSKKGSGYSYVSISNKEVPEQLYYIKDKSKAGTMWIIAPGETPADTVIRINRYGIIYSTPPVGDSQESYAGFRPVVCISENIKLVDNENGTYRLDDK